MLGLSAEVSKISVLEKVVSIVALPAGYSENRLSILPILLTPDFPLPE